MQEWNVGDTPVLQGTVTDNNGNPLTPTTITVVVTDPANHTVTMTTPVVTTTGVYQSTFTTAATLSGTYRADWTVTLTGTPTDTASFAYTFVVNAPATSAVAPAPLQVGQLCTPQDVQDRVVRTMTAAELSRANALINDASVQIRSYTRRSFVQQQITQFLRSTSKIIKIPQVPVISVDAVALVDYLGTAYAVPSFGFDGIDQIDLGYYSSVLNLPEDALSYGSVWSGSVKLTWTYGYNTVPADVASVCAQMVARIFNTPGAGVVGVQLERIGPFEMRLGEGNGNNNSTSLTGVLSMTQQDKDTLRYYRSVATVLDLGQ